MRVATVRWSSRCACASASQRPPAFAPPRPVPVPRSSFAVSICDCSTSDNEQQVPKEALDALGNVVSGGSEADKADLAALLAQRLREPSISVKLKVLRVIMVLAGRGGSSFAEHLRVGTLSEMQAHTEFQAPPDPKHGEKPKLMIRAAAVKCIRTVEEQLAAPSQPGPGPGGGLLVAAVEQLTAKVQQMDAKSVALDERLVGLEAWLADVEDKLATRSAASPEPSGDSAMIQALQEGQATTNTRLSQLDAAGDRLSSVEGQLAAVQEGLAEAKSSVTTATDSSDRRFAEQQQALEAVRSELAGIASSVSTLDASCASSTKAAAASLAALEANVARDLKQLQAAPAAGQGDTLGAATRDELDALKGQLADIHERLGEQESLVSVVDETVTATKADLSQLVTEQVAALESVVAERVDSAVSSWQNRAPASKQDEDPQPTSVTSEQFSQWSDLQTRRMSALEQQFASSAAELAEARESSADSTAALRKLDEKLSSHLQSLDAALSDIAGIRTDLSALERSQFSTVEASTDSMTKLRTDLEQQREQIKAIETKVAAQPQSAPGVETAELDSLQARVDDYQASVDARIVEKVEAAVSSLNGLCIGDRCEVLTDGCRGNGTIGYTGSVDGKDGIWLGVELDDAKGRNDGSVQGRRYFSCAQGHGVFISPSKVRKIAVSEAMASALEEERGVTLATLQLLREDRAKDYETHSARAQRNEAKLAEVEKRGAEMAETIQTTQSQFGQLKEQVAGMDALISQKVQAAVEELDVRLAEQEGLLSVVDEMAQKTEDDLAKSVSSVAEHMSTRAAIETELRAQIVTVQNLAAPEKIDAKVTATVALVKEEQSQRFAGVGAEIKSLRDLISSYPTAEQMKSVEVKADERLRELAKLVGEKIERLDMNIKSADSRIEDTNASLDAVQDAHQQRIDAMQQWLQRTEAQVSTADASTGQVLETTQRLDEAIKGLVSTDVLQRLATGIKTQLDAVRAETEATEGKVLELLKKHMALSEQKLLGAIGRDEFDRYAEDTDDRCKLLEERFESVLQEANGQRESAERAIVDLQQTLATQAEQAERQQEPLSIRVSTVEVRYADGKSSKP